MAGAKPDDTADGGFDDGRCHVVLKVKTGSRPVRVEKASRIIRED